MVVTAEKLEELLAINAEHERTIAQHERTIAQQASALDRLQADLRALKQALYRLGRIPPALGETPGQLFLFGEEPAPVSPPSEKQPRKNSGTGGKRNGREGVPKSVRRETVDVEVDDTLYECDCGAPGCRRVVFDYDKTETAEITPQQLFVLVTRRPKLVCPRGLSGVLTPLAEKRVVDRCLAGDSLLTFVILQKFLYHVPLHRTAKKIRGMGWPVKENTICGWVHAVADGLLPIYLAMKQDLLKQPYLQADETPAKARDPNTKGKLKQVYFWVYSSPWKEMVFDYQPSRSGRCARDFLADFRGTVLQVDEYSGYDAYFRENPHVSRAGCWGHAIRKFIEAAKAGDRTEESKILCHLIGRMLRFETAMRKHGLSHDERLRRRKRTLQTRVDRIESKVDDILANPKVEPTSTLGKAVRYQYNCRESLRVFLARGDVEADNNSVEHGLRNLAIGRKNWMHIGHIGAGHAAAILYTLVISCVRLGIDPEAYLTDIFRRLPTMPANRVIELTPRRWRDAQANQG